MADEKRDDGQQEKNLVAPQEIKNEKIIPNKDLLKEPKVVKVTSQPQTIRIEWERSSEEADGYMLLIGQKLESLGEYQKIKFRQGEVKIISFLGGLETGHTYYVSVVNFKGEVLSALPGVWRALIPKEPRLWVAEKLELDLLPKIERLSIEEAPKEIKIGLLDDEDLKEAMGPEPLVVAQCGKCGGSVVLDEEKRVYKCRKCDKLYVQRLDEKYISVDLLPNGICSCCNPKRPLILAMGEEGFFRCSQSSDQYCELENVKVRVKDLTYGLCSCCKPARPLVLSAESQVVCSKNRQQLYEKKGRGRSASWKPVPRTDRTGGVDINRLDEELEKGMAKIGTNGVILP